MQLDRLLVWYCPPSVRLSFCDAVYCAVSGTPVRCIGWKLYHLVHRTALPIHFITHFCCRMYPSATIHRENWTAEISASGIATGNVVTWPWLFQTRHFRRFGSVAIPYIVRSTIGLLCDSYASCSLCDILISIWDYFVLWIFSVSRWQHRVGRSIVINVVARRQPLNNHRSTETVHAADRWSDAVWHVR